MTRVMDFLTCTTYARLCTTLARVSLSSDFIFARLDFRLHALKNHKNCTTSINIDEYRTRAYSCKNSCKKIAINIDEYRTRAKRAKKYIIEIRD